MKLHWCFPVLLVASVALIGCAASGRSGHDARYLGAVKSAGPYSVARYANPDTQFVGVQISDHSNSPEYFPQDSLDATLRFADGHTEQVSLEARDRMYEDPLYFDYDDFSRPPPSSECLFTKRLSGEALAAGMTVQIPLPYGDMQEIVFEPAQ